MHDNEKLRIVREMVDEAEVEELERIWGLGESVSLEQQQGLAAEADQADDFVLLELPSRRPQRWHLVVGMVLAVVAAIVYAEFILWLPKVGRLLQ